MSRTRWVIEGEWSGYTSSQAKIVHREVTTDPRLVDALHRNHGIMYTDGTWLYLTIREAKPHEKVAKIDRGYGSMIKDCARAGVWSVQELTNLRKPTFAEWRP